MPKEERRKKSRGNEEAPVAVLSPAGAAAGFNLLELLIAMTVLVAVVTVACAVFTHSDEAWFRGTGRAANLSAGRAAMDLMTLDLQQAVADSRLTFRVQQDRALCASYGFTNDEVCLVSLQSDSSDTNRTAREIAYWVRRETVPYERYQLVRGCHAISNVSDTAGLDNCYFYGDWFKDLPEGGAGRPSGPDVGVLVDNVAALAFDCPAVTGHYDSRDYTNRLPEYLDVFLEVLDERAARQANDLAADPPAQRDFVERKARRYSTRINFLNRQGYEPR